MVRVSILVRVKVKFRFKVWVKFSVRASIIRFRKPKIFKIPNQRVHPRKLISTYMYYMYI